MKVNSLINQISNFEFHPEVYVYPTPRMLKPVNKFSLEKVEYTDEVNIYVHIPFCKQICSYCGYLKVVDSERKLMNQYIDALIKELRSYKNILKNKIIKTLHFGGGTPSLLTPLELNKIMKVFLEINPDILKTADEVSIEATPESVEFEKFLKYKKIGINRVSMGVQTLDDNEIKLCRRNNFLNVFTNAMKILRKVGIPNLVLDLMIGLEGQTVKSFEESVKSLLKYFPETVEFYAVGLMPNTLLDIKKPKLMSNRDIYRCYQVGRKLFLDAGYVQDCHNRYIFQGKGGFFQEDYLFSGMSLIGLGAGARTYAKEVHYRNNYYDKFHMKSVIEYIEDMKSNCSPIKSAVFLDAEEKMRQYVIYNLESLDKKEFRKIFGIGFSSKFSKLYSELLKMRLIKEDWRRIWLTPKGLTFRDLICKQFFSKKEIIAEEKYRPK